jgi:hypothetical protein
MMTINLRSIMNDTSTLTIPPFVIERATTQGLTYEQYMATARARVEATDPATLDDEARHRHEVTQLNFRRSDRIERTYQPSENLRRAIASIREPQVWMVISESWCGDSAQNLPHIMRLASLNPMIDLRILERDSHPDVMDEFLTGTARSIPIFVAWDVEGRQLLRWGPRPAAGVRLVDELKSAGKVKDEILEQLHLWYGRNRGADLEAELLALLTPLVPSN